MCIIAFIVFISSRKKKKTYASRNLSRARISAIPQCNPVVRLVFLSIEYLYLYCNVSVHPRHSRRHIKKSITASIYNDTPLRRPSFLARRCGIWLFRPNRHSKLTRGSFMKTDDYREFVHRLQNQLADPIPSFPPLASAVNPGLKYRLMRINSIINFGGSSKDYSQFAHSPWINQ